MAEKIAEGYGVGVVFEDRVAGSVAGVLLDALQSCERLGAAARQIAPRVGEETSCRRFIERMIALSQTAPDMEPRYQIGDEIDFSDVLDSRCFMREGWGETEPWGVWTVGGRAGLTLQLEADCDGPLILNALAVAFLGKRNAVCVRVSAAGRQIAEWIFDTASSAAGQPRWLSALLPWHEGDFSSRVVDISFEVDAPTSPLAEGLSGDPRTLGLGLYKISLHSAVLS